MFKAVIYCEVFSVGFQAQMMAHTSVAAVCTGDIWKYTSSGSAHECDVSREQAYT